MFRGLTVWGQPGLFDQLLRGDLALLNEELATFAPKINVAESEKEVRVTAELPGVDEKDIRVNLTKEGLAIAGEKKQESEEKGKNFYRFERSYGSFHRLVPLPDEIDREKAEASFKKGVLSVVIPKAPGAGPKKIDIKSE